ncbi:MAG: signal recognition particle protein [Candidatus Aenigmarchaeota archaeon]|nr:signal recognition particle protein [Candidatus Aenigmarchaeota archaeon]
MLKALSDTLREAIDKVARLGTVDKDVVDGLVKDIQRALIAADVDVKLVFQLSERIKQRAFEKLPEGLTRKEHVIRVVYEELVNVLGKHKPHIELSNKKVLLAGLFGSGKTSTAAKLARFYQKKGMKPALIGCDTARPAAYEQLQQLAQKIDVPFYGEKNEKDAATIVRNALRQVRADVLIVDSSGRNALDRELVGEIQRVNRELNADERILVVPADIGQAARQQAKAFHDALGITDVIVTKLDATARGGGALTACHETGAQVKFITTGETVEDLQMYDPEKFVSRLLGMPDIEALLEKAKTTLDEKRAEKIMGGDFTLDDFYSQIEGVQKMGPLSGILDMMGLGRIGSKMDTNVQEKKMKRWKYLLQSMTMEERADPALITSSRIRRIAHGSGRSESDVRELLNNYNSIRKMMKKISPAKLKRSGMQGLFRQFGMK